LAHDANLVIKIMEPKLNKTNHFEGASRIALGYFVLAVLWPFLLACFIDADSSAEVRNQYLKIGGVLAITLLGGQHILLRMLLNRKHHHHKQAVELYLDRNSWGFLDDIPANIAIVSKDGHYQHWSLAFHQNIMPYLSDKEISEICLLADDHILLHNDGHPFSNEERPIDKAIRTGEKISSVNVGIPVGNNDWVWVDLCIIPRKNAVGRILDYVCLFQLASDTHTAETNLTIQSFQDRLTGLPNRSLFSELLSQAIFRMEKQNSRVGVLFLDLNRFKAINDTLGREVGDKLLLQVSKRLRLAVRQGGTIARLGGDDFVALFEDFDDLSEVIFMVDWIKNIFEEPFILGDSEFYVGCSFGLAISDKPDVTSAELIRDAEIAMYRAKAKGSDTLEIYDQSMNNQTHDRLKMENDMRYALQRNEFIANYQPLINLDTGKIGGWEALIRWRHPERGLVPPIEFIGLAEETGLIISVGAWILEEACRQAQIWRERFPSYSESIMSVNLSMRQFQQQDIAKKIIEIIEKHHFDPRLLKLEITESATMRDPATNLAVMNALKAYKIKLAIDDFGTGYSSLSYLKRMPVNTLKIDKSFVDGLGLDGESTAIIETIISLAKVLGMNVTAEGIETADQFSLLKTMGCDIGQGYYFSRPLLPADAEKLMERDAVW